MGLRKLSWSLGIVLAVLLAGAALPSGPAHAQFTGDPEPEPGPEPGPEPSPEPSPSPSPSPSPTPSPAPSPTPSSEAEARAAESGTEASATANTRITNRRLIALVNRRTSSMLLTGQPAVPFVRREDLASGPLTGLSGGEGTESWALGRLGLWADGAGTVSGGFRRPDKFWAGQYSVMVGADVRVPDDILAGASLGYEHVDVDFNTNRDRTVHYTFATVYGAALLTDTLSVDGLASYGVGANTTREPAGSVLGTGEYDYLSHRVIAATSLSYNTMVGERVTVFGNGGITYSHEAFEGYDTASGIAVETSDAFLGQLHLEGELGYVFEYGAESRLQPFLTTRLEYDYITSIGGERFGALVGGGLRAQISPAFSVEASGRTEVARTESTSTSFALTSRFQF
ncbi:autotransporter outer membrane beta-barrel domain-containing protein [Roseospira navarrensis]|uniref:Autotransporter domain-containing protein n=1 Tax=Roseospira navarrensis TaxID=140058 RepID=A0A7X1ZEG2_9PROT|nr:autotransporter outer membrane beta-barrel domain-containing protein [Roseospira navarrensis]MQX36091.1 autotransporter domain-containing protein [Roseospira navarrensis]